MQYNMNTDINDEFNYDNILNIINNKNYDKFNDLLNNILNSKKETTLLHLLHIPHFDNVIVSNSYIKNYKMNYFYDFCFFRCGSTAMVTFMAGSTIQASKSPAPLTNAQCSNAGFGPTAFEIELQTRLVVSARKDSAAIPTKGVIRMIHSCLVHVKK